jgi:hypothetical protein
MPDTSGPDTYEQIRASSKPRPLLMVVVQRQVSTGNTELRKWRCGEGRSGRWGEIAARQDASLCWAFISLAGTPRIIRGPELAVNLRAWRDYVSSTGPPYGGDRMVLDTRADSAGRLEPNEKRTPFLELTHRSSLPSSVRTRAARGRTSLAERSCTTFLQSFQHLASC